MASNFPSNLEEKRMQQNIRLTRLRQSKQLEQLQRKRDDVCRTSDSMQRRQKKIEKKELQEVKHCLQMQEKWKKVEETERDKIAKIENKMTSLKVQLKDAEGAAAGQQGLYDNDTRLSAELSKLVETLTNRHGLAVQHLGDLVQKSKLLRSDVQRLWEQKLEVDAAATRLVNLAKQKEEEKMKILELTQTYQTNRRENLAKTTELLEQSKKEHVDIERKLRRMAQEKSYISTLGSFFEAKASSRKEEANLLKVQEVEENKPQDKLEDAILQTGSSELPAILSLVQQQEGQLHHLCTSITAVKTDIEGSKKDQLIEEHKGNQKLTTLEG